MRENIKHIALSPCNSFLLMIDMSGRVALLNFRREVLLAQFSLKKTKSVVSSADSSSLSASSIIGAVAFSPDSSKIAIGVDRLVQIWQTPLHSLTAHKEFAPFVLQRTLTGHYDTVFHVDWSPDGLHLLTASRDMSVRVHSMVKWPSSVAARAPPAAILSGHRDQVIGAFFSRDQRRVYTVTRDGLLFCWCYSPSPADALTPEQQARLAGLDPALLAQDQLSSAAGQWRLRGKHFFLQPHAQATSCHLHRDTEQLTVGFSNGVFGLWSLAAGALGSDPGEHQFDLIHQLSISSAPIEACAANRSGEWLALGVPQHGQLLVWEWRSESYILKQQGHTIRANALAYSPNGQTLATGGEDGKVKLWNVRNALCFATFDQHAAAVTDICFAPNGTAVFSASRDGTVRAFDLTRYRNFRVFSAASESIEAIGNNVPQQQPFSCVAVDPSSEVVAAGSLHSFSVFLWNLQTGKLLDILHGHQAPIACLAFNPLQPTLASGGWDGACRVWDVYGATKDGRDVLDHPADVLALQFRPDGEEVATACLDGQLRFWSVSEGTLLRTIDGRKDICGGRLSTDRRTAQSSAGNKHFTSICYSADGVFLLAGGNSKYVCIYHVQQRVLVSRFQISRNVSLDGVLDKLDSRLITDAGLSLAELELDARDKPRQANLPGVQRPDLSKRIKKVPVQTKCVRFSPNGRQWAAAASDGMLLYSLDEFLAFDPFDLDIEITPKTILQAMQQEEFLKGLVMAVKLAEKDLLVQVLEVKLPHYLTQRLAADFPIAYLKKFLSFLGARLESTPHVEFYMVWILNLFRAHSQYIRLNAVEFLPVLRNIHKNSHLLFSNLRHVCDNNQYSLSFLSSMFNLRIKNPPHLHTLVEEDAQDAPIQPSSIHFSSSPQEQEEDSEIASHLTLDDDNDNNDNNDDNDDNDNNDDNDDNDFSSLSTSFSKKSVKHSAKNSKRSRKNK